MIGRLRLLVGHPVGKLPVFIFIGGNKPYQIKRRNCKENDLNSILNLMFEVVKSVSQKWHHSCWKPTREGAGPGRFLGVKTCSML